MEKSSLTEKGRAVLFCACVYWNEKYTTLLTRRKDCDIYWHIKQRCKLV